MGRTGAFGAFAAAAAEPSKHGNFSSSREVTLTSLQNGKNSKNGAAAPRPVPTLSLEEVRALLEELRTVSSSAKFQKDLQHLRSLDWGAFKKREAVAKLLSIFWKAPLRRFGFGIDGQGFPHLLQVVKDSHSLEPSAPPAEAVATVIVPAVPKAVPAVPAVPSPPAAPAAAATVVAGGGYPSGPSAAAKPAAKPAAHPKVFGVKPTVVWVDGNPEAFQTSRLNTERGITFQGFPSPKGGGGRPWVSYIQERMVADARVAVAIMNSKHKEDAAEIRKFCEERRVQPPRFIVMCGKRNTPEDVRRDWGMKDLLVVHDWGDAATAALNEVGSAHHSGPTVRAGVEM